MIRTTHIAALALVFSGAMSSPLVARAEGASAPEASRVTQVGELFRQANKLYDEKKLTSAEALYHQAWALQKTYDIASNLGALELDMGKPAEAAEFLTYALRQFPARGKLADRTALAARLAEAKKAVCTLHLTASEPGAQIFVDGQSVGSAPLADDVYVAAGKRTIEARQSGRRTAKQVISATAGLERTVLLKLDPLPEARKRSVVPGLVVGATGLLGLGVGGTLIGLAESSRASATKLHDSLAASGVSCATASASCSQLKGFTSRADTLGNAGIGALAFGGAVAVAGLAYLLWPTSRPAPTGRDTALTASFGASPVGGSVNLAGSF
jgi:hypothetical protein